MIYFARCGSDGPIKIGHTISDLASRISFLQVGCPWPITIMGTMEGDAQAESALLKRFAHVNMRGEWFHATPDLLAFISVAVTPPQGRPRKVVVPIFAPADVGIDEDWQAIDVKSIREGLGLTQAQFGHLVGVDQSTISNWEKGETRPRGPAIKVIESVRAQSSRLPQGEKA